MQAIQTPQEMAAQVNAMLCLSAPVPGTAANGWFGGYGCRWCFASRAWFTVVPFDASAVANKVAELFRAAGIAATITNEGGVSQAAQGRGLQVSAYVESI